MEKLGKMTEVTDLRTIWKDEANNFTPWLAKEDNIALLGDKLGIEIEVEEIESPVGPFSVDIFAREAGTGRKIIIENQLEDTNHTHLGQIVTYAAGKNAQIVIWIVKNAREEHQAAIEWLNNHTDDEIGFFLCEIKLYQIDNSPVAPFFNIIEQPNEWSKEAKRSVESLTPAGQFNLEYWTEFGNFCKQEKEFLHFFKKERKPGKNNWLDFGLGSKSVHLMVKISSLEDLAAVYVYISDDKDVFKKLLEHKEEIEGSLHMVLDWQEKPNYKASTIGLEKSFSIKNQDQWPMQFQWIINSLIALKTTFQPYLKK